MASHTQTTVLTPRRNKRQSEGKMVRILFYLLTAYILLQFAWWAYLLIDLNSRYFAAEGAEVVRLKIWMIVGEGTVFITFLLAGIFIMQRTIRKEIALVRQQRNFLLSITHELKTPVAAIKLCLQTLIKRDTLDAEQREPLQRMAIENTERLHSLIDNVLLATRIESGQEPVQFELTDISVHTNQICEGVNRTISRKNPIQIIVQDGVSARVDRSAYESILLNLLENAVKYAGETSIDVSLEKTTVHGILTVTDGGPGIPASAKNRIFEKFYRMGNEETRSKKGTGLGLYIVKELAELHNAKISVEDNKPSGTIFRVVFPL